MWLKVVAFHPNIFSSAIAFSSDVARDREDDLQRDPRDSRGSFEEDETHARRYAIHAFRVPGSRQIIETNFDFFISSRNKISFIQSLDYITFEKILRLHPIIAKNWIEKILYSNSDG